jgi:hypothetical protein
MNVTTQAIKSGIVPQAPDNGQWRSRVQLIIQPRVFLYMLGLTVKNELWAVENTDIRE